MQSQYKIEKEQAKGRFSNRPTSCWSHVLKYTGAGDSHKLPFRPASANPVMPVLADVMRQVHRVLNNN